MEILGGGADDEELRLERERRARKGAGGDQDGARPPKRVAAALDLGTMDLAPDTPAAYRRPPAPTPHADPHPAPHPAPYPAPSFTQPSFTPPSYAEPTQAAPSYTAPNSAHYYSAPTQAPPSSMADEWAALRRATAAGAGSGPDTPDAGRDTLASGPARVELNLDEEPAEPPHPTHERDYRADLVSAVLGSPSLALAGILVCVAGLFGGIPLLMLYVELTGGAGESGAKIVAKGLAGLGVTGAVLGFTALRRMRASTARWVPTVAGAALLLGVVLLVVAGYFWWTGDHAVPVEDY